MSPAEQIFPSVRGASFPRLILDVHVSVAQLGQTDLTPRTKLSAVKKRSG